MTRRKKVNNFFVGLYRYLQSVFGGNFVDVLLDLIGPSWCFVECTWTIIGPFRNELEPCRVPSDLRSRLVIDTGGTIPLVHAFQRHQAVPLLRRMSSENSFFCPRGVIIEHDFFFVYEKLLCDPPVRC